MNVLAAARPFCVRKSAPIPRISSHRRVIGVAAGCIALAVPAAVADAAPDDDGFLFTSPDGEYTVVFPAQPAPFSDVMSADFGGYPMDLHGTVSAAGFLMAASVDVPSGSAGTLDEMTGAILDDLGVQGAATRIDLRGVPGVEFSGPYDDVVDSGSVRGRVYVSADSAYVLLVMGFESEVRMDDATVAVFFASFDFVKEAF